MNKPTRKTNRQMQAEETKQKILDSCAKLLAEQGFDAVKITDICADAGVSVGSFYHHIGSKAGIIVEGYSQCDEYFANEVFPRFASRTDIGAVGDYIGYQMQYAVNLGLDIMTQLYKAQLTEATDFFLSDERQLPAGLERIIANLQQAHVLSDAATAEQIAGEILILSRGTIMNWCQCRGSYDLVKRGKRLVEQYLIGYKRDGAHDG